MKNLLETAPDDVTAEDLRTHLDSASVPALIMLTVHVTGDTSLLRDEWRPSLPALPESGLSAEVDAEARRVCFDALAPHLDRQHEWDSEPSDELREQITTWLMSAPVEDALALSKVSFVPNGEDPRTPDWTLDEVAPGSALSAIVIGTGFSGLLAGLRFKQAGVPFTIIEKNHDVGGTWWENTYPDCRTDVRSHIYTYSFVQSDWPTHFGRQALIHDYLHRFAVDNGLMDHIEFGHEVTAATWNEEEQTWTVETKTDDGDEKIFDTNVLVSAVGQLNKPSYPNIEGIDSFKGTKLHSARWDHDVDFTGKRVAVIGTGASALQFAPPIARVADEMTIFQRSAPWLKNTPVLRQDIDPGERWLLNHLHQYRAYYRYSIFLPRVVGNLPNATVDPEYGPTEKSVSAANEQLRKDLTAYLTDQADGDEELLAQITPNYPPAAKRIICDDGTWVKTLKRDNVRLVTHAVTRVDETGVWFGDEHVKADIIIFGTGFKAADFLMPMKITGTEGRDLHEEWGIDASAFMGTALPGYPNFFCMYGPNTNTVIHGNLVFFLECQANYIADAIKVLAEDGKKSLDLKPEVFDEYDKKIVAESSKRTWGWSKTHSWYMNAEGRSTIMWPLPAREYYEGTHHVRREHFDFK